MNNVEILNKALDILKSAGLRQSPQRSAVLAYLMTHATHPSAEVIYQELSPYYPTMSLTTVYNTLKALTEAGTIYTLKIERANAHFDYPHYPHSHFRCRCCGEIFDVPLDENVLDKIDKNKYHVESVEIYYQGLCDNCFLKQND